jgi:hypothetical protein
MVIGKRSTANGEEIQVLFTGFSPSRAGDFYSFFTVRAAQPRRANRVEKAEQCEWAETNSH